MVKIYIVYKYGEFLSVHFNYQEALRAGGDIDEHYINTAEVAYLINHLKAQGNLCENCCSYIASDLCWCGQTAEEHSAWNGHTFVPMGCNCQRG